ncbi:MAG: radical SAM protein [Deltaproteobacteria bacterium]|nr:radical SAM protein [Deltaproteobacteria bacterium]
MEKLLSMLKRCELCPRKCRVDRTKGEVGFCRLSDDVVMNSAFPHYGEEPPLSGTRGAGTIFLSSCNLRCSYCQNYQISHDIQGERLDVEGLSRTMLHLQDKLCHNIEPVTPTPHVPRLIQALIMARQKGLRLPFVYNCGGYEDPDVIGMLDGMVDIYLPDFKYGNSEDALTFSGVDDYHTYALASLREMVRQVGDSLETEGGVALRGVLVRHLVLPGSVANSFAVLEMIREKVSRRVPLSIMAQYTPIPAVSAHPLLSRRITRAEYESVVNRALDLGFENIFTQAVDERALTPDFERDEPFNW